MASEPQYTGHRRFLADLQEAVDQIVIGQWEGDKAWDYLVEANNDGSISVKATANQTVFLDTVYHSLVFAREESGRMALKDDPDASIRGEFDEFHVAGTFQQIGEEMERNYLAIHKACEIVAAKHGVPFVDTPPAIRKGGVRIAEDSMLAKLSDAALLTEIERRGLSLNPHNNREI